MADFPELSTRLQSVQTELKVPKATTSTQTADDNIDTFHRTPQLIERNANIPVARPGASSY